MSTARPPVRIALGIDLLGAYVPAASLLEAMRFQAESLALIHVAAERPPIVSGHGVDGLDERYHEDTERLGRAALDKARGALLDDGRDCVAHLVRGRPAEGLVNASEALEADVVAVNAVRRQALGVNAIGSVTSGLTAAGKSCLLIAKGGQARQNDLRAVFATDHSRYAERSLDRFLELAPKGIAEILVVSPWQIEEDDAERLARDLAMTRPEVDRWIEESIERLSAKTCARLEAAGYKSSYRVVRGGANDEIDIALADARADLLIVGSLSGEADPQTLLLSVSLSHVVASSAPLLLLRPKEV